MAYPGSFFLAVLGKTFRIGIILIFFSAIYLKTEFIGDWNFAQVLLLFATFSLIDFLMSVTFHRNLAFWFPNSIKKGTFDFKIIKPINLQFYTSFEIIDLMDLTSIIPCLILLWFALWKLNFAFTIGQIFLYIFLIINALIFIHSILLILATFTFWTIQTTGMGRFFENIIRMARYPTDIYSGIIKILLVYVIPISLIAVVPSKALLGTLSWQFLIFAVLFSLILFLIANRFWHFGLKHYQSASS